MTKTDHFIQLHEQRIGIGVVCGILAAFSFTMMSLLGKIIGDRVSTDTILFARFAISLLLIVPWAIKYPQETLHAAKPMAIILRSLFTFMAFACFFYALRFIPLANALLFNNTFPLFVPLIVWTMVKHHTSYRVWIGIIIGFIGVGFVLKPASDFFQSASMIGLASGVFAAIAVVMIRRLTKTTPVLQILFYNFFICTLLTGIFLPFEWKSFNTEMLFLLIGVGLCGSAYQFFSTLSYAKTPVRISSPLMFLCIVFGVIADWLIWNKIPDGFTLIGMVCVIVGGTITIYFGQKEIMKK